MGKEQELLDAARSGNTAIVERILNHRIKKSGPLASLRRGPGPNTQDSSGYTCLHHAALNGHKSIVSLLLQHDANPNLVDNKGSTALHLAAWTGNYDIVHVILTQSSLVPNVNLKNNDQETPLHSASQYGHTSVVSLLLQHGSDPLVRNNKEESPLDLASQYGRYETVDVLIRTRPNLVNDLIKKHSPLHLAARNGHRNVVRLLLNAKFDVNYLTEKGTALHEAALYGKVEVVKLLLDYGIDVELEDEQRRTVLDLLKDINTNIAKQTKKVIKEHTTLVSTEDDSSTVISDSSSHCISPPPGYTDATPEHNVLLPEKIKSISTQSQSPTSGFTSPANSEFNFYEVPPPPRLSLQSKRSSGTSDDYITTKNFFSRSQDSILDGYSTSSSRSPSFLDYETPPPLPPREKMMSSRVLKSTDPSHLLFEVPPVPSPVNGTHPYGNSSRKETEVQRPDSQSSTGTWSNHSSSGYMPMSGKPIPPVKPPRKSISPLNRALSQQQYHSKSQHQLHIQSNRTSVCEYMAIGGNSEGGMKRSASNDGDGYVEMRSVVGANNRFSTFLGDDKQQPIYANQSVDIVNESAFSALYDQIANGTSSYVTSPVPIQTSTSKTSSLCRSFNPKAAKPPALHQRSKSEHHPRCPNFEVSKRDNSADSDAYKNKRATVQIPLTVNSYQSLSNTNARGSLPSCEEAEEGILSVVKKLNQISEDSKACVNGWSQSPHSSDMDPLDSTDPNSDSDYDFDSYTSSDDFVEYKKLLTKDAETVTEESQFATTNSKGRKVKVKLRNSENKTKLRSKSVKADIAFDGIVKEDNPFAGLCRGSVHSRSSAKSNSSVEQAVERKPKMGKYCETTLERKKKFKTLPSKLKHPKPDASELQKPVTIEIKPIEMPITANNSSNNNNWESFPRLMPISPFDENKEWAEIENIMASFGSGLEKEIVFSDDEKESKESKLAAKSVKEWLLDLSLQEYTDLFIVNGFDDLNFMGPNVMESSDLCEMGIENEHHRSKILDAAKCFPLIKKLDKDVSLTVDEWLKSLNLIEYSSRFNENGFSDMNSVRNIWDVELNAVLEINKLGHRKRILASLGERLSLITDFGFDDFDFNKLNFGIDLLTNEVSREEEEEEGEVKKDTHNLERRSVSSNDLSKYSPKSKHVKDEITSYSSEETASNRSSTQSMISSTPLSTQWKHSPFDLYKNKCEYKASYLGSTLVRHLQGIQSTNESIKKLKESTKNIKKVPSVILAIDYTGVKFIDAQTNVVVCEHEIRNIHFACQDADDFKHFAYITKEHETSNNYCHVFRAPTLDLATEVILTLGQAFEVAYRLALGEDIHLLHQIYQANQITATPPAPPPRTSSFIATSTLPPTTTSTLPSTTAVTLKSSIPKPITTTANSLKTNTEVYNKKAMTIPKLKPIVDAKVLKPKPAPPMKPPSLIKSCQSSGSLMKKGKL